MCARCASRHERENESAVLRDKHFVEMFIANRGNSDLEIDRPVNSIRVQLSCARNGRNGGFHRCFKVPSFAGERLALNWIYLSSRVCAWRAWVWLENAQTHEQLIKREKRTESSDRFR